MGRKGFNWKARLPSSTIIDNSQTKNLKHDLNTQNEHYDTCNELILPSTKRKTKAIKEKQQTTRILSKQHRKRLEKVVERKKKKEQRAGLLDALKEVQATPEELAQLTSINSIQTKGLKRHFWEQNFPEKVISKGEVKKFSEDCSNFVVNSIKGAKRLKVDDLITKEKSNDPNVVGFEDSASSCSDFDDNEEIHDIKEEIENIKEDNEDLKEDNDDLKEDNEDLKDNNADKDDNEDIKENNEDIKEEIEENEVLTEKTQENVVKMKQNEKNEVTVKTESRKEVPNKKATFVEVLRDEEIQKARLKLPILAEEQQIMETINENDVVIIAGETGSGKTTQIPQFLYEAGYTLNGKLIGITEPRRVAAISMSERVSVELSSKNLVSYLIRFQGNVTEDTRIKFMTDGVLLKEIQSDFLLSKYSVIILDEAHERSVYTDILIGLLSRVVPLRRKRENEQCGALKVIVMSATLRLEDFTHNRRLFKSVPPVVNVDARQFPVTVHFNKRTRDDYLAEAFRKTCKVHSQLPDGGVLVFLTGQREVNWLVRKLRAKFPMKSWNRVANEINVRKNSRKKKKIMVDVDLDDYGLPCDNEDDCDQEDDDDLDIDDPIDLEQNLATTTNIPLWVLPLYSLLPSEKQSQIFKPPPPGCRLCIVATNVAETSLTIPNIKYVIDSGRTKVKLYDRVTGVTTYTVDWTSQASADQRSGRAGRTAPGHCYRLYSSAVFNDTFAKFAQPEIQRKPVDDLYLQMKCMHIDKIVNFPFPSAPDLVQLKSAERRLKVLGVLDDDLKVTSMGRVVAKFPLLPRFGKMLALSHQFDLLEYVVTLVAALSVQEVLLEVPLSVVDTTQTVKKFQELRYRWSTQGQGSQGHLLGDAYILLKAVGASEFAHSKGKLEEFCLENGLRHKAITEIRKLRFQLSSEIRQNVKEIDVLNVNPLMPPPNDLQCKLLRQIVLAGNGDQIARKIQPDEIEGTSEEKKKFKYAYRANDMEDPVFLHQNSVLKRSLPEFLVYQEIYETNKVYLRGATAIEPEWLVKYVPTLCNLGEPLEDPCPRFDDLNGCVLCTVNGTFGRQGWTLPAVEIEYKGAPGAYKWFARFFLEGKVFPRLEKYVTSLLSAPSTMVKSWIHLQRRSDSLFKCLMSNGVCTKSGLMDLWDKEPKFLLQEYLLWIPESAHGEVSLMWPPVVQDGTTTKG